MTIAVASRVVIAARLGSIGRHVPGVLDGVPRATRELSYRRLGSSASDPVQGNADRQGQPRVGSIPQVAIGPGRQAALTGFRRRTYDPARQSTRVGPGLVSNPGRKGGRHMRTPVIGLLAASLSGPTASNNRPAHEITYQIEFLEMDGLGWRSSLHPQLQPVARQGTATVWTAPRETASRSRRDGRPRSSARPEVTASPEGRRTVSELHDPEARHRGHPRGRRPGQSRLVRRLRAPARRLQRGYSAEVSGRKTRPGGAHEA